MIKVGSFLKACAGSFDSTVSSRPVTPVFFSSPPPAGSEYRSYRYQPGDGGTFFAMQANPRRAPYATLQWLIRNATQPLIGQEPLDFDGVPGVAFMSPTGWASSGRVLRVPKSLVIFGDQIALPFGDPDWVAAVTAAIGPLTDLGVDVYLCISYTGGSRFIKMVPLTDASFVTAITSPVAAGVYLDATAAPPTDLEGGKVMVASICFFSTGYATNENAEPGYVTLISGSAATFSRAVTLFDNVGFDFVYMQDETASIEAGLLLPIVAQCNAFVFDVYGNDSNEPFTTAAVPTLEECDAAFRNGVPGNAYHYSFTGTADYPALAAQIVANALTFFS